MATEYIARKKREKEPPQFVAVIRKKEYPIEAQIKEAAEAIKKWCPEIFKQDDPYPTVRMVKFKEDEIVYEITEGKKASRGNVGSM